MNRASSFAGSVAVATMTTLLAGCGGPAPAPSTDTFWLAPNGSEVVLKLVPTPQTVPF